MLRAKVFVRAQFILYVSLRPTDGGAARRTPVERHAAKLRHGNLWLSRVTVARGPHVYIRPVVRHVVVRSGRRTSALYRAVWRATSTPGPGRIGPAGCGVLNPSAFGWRTSEVRVGLWSRFNQYNEMPGSPSQDPLGGGTGHGPRLEDPYRLADACWSTPGSSLPTSGHGATGRVVCRHVRARPRQFDLRKKIFANFFFLFFVSLSLSADRFIFCYRGRFRAPFSSRVHVDYY